MHSKNINRKLLQLVFEGLTHNTKKPPPIPPKVKKCKQTYLYLKQLLHGCTKKCMIQEKTKCFLSDNKSVGRRDVFMGVTLNM